MTTTADRAPAETVTRPDRRESVEAARERGRGLLNDVRALFPRIRGESDSIDSTRRISPELIQELYDVGVFRALMPKEVGGLELDPISWLDVVEETSRANGSVGWLSMINSGQTFLGAEVLKTMLDRDGARWIAAINAGRASGKARRAPGGYRVTGRWPFASSAPYASFAGGLSFLVDDDDVMVIHPNDGLPWVVLGIVDEGQFTHIDTWDSLGMRGTGSGEIELNDVFIPEERTMLSLNDWPYDAPVYRAASLFQIAGHAANALGIARSAVEELIKAANRPPSFGSQRGMTLGRQQYHHIAVARADATIRAARAFCWESVANAFEAAIPLERGERVPLELRVLLRESTTFAVRSAKEATNLVYEIAGAPAVMKGNHLERAYRDVTTAAQHLMHVEETLGLSGQYWLTKDGPDGPQVDGGLMAFF